MMSRRRFFHLLAAGCALVGVKVKPVEMCRVHDTAYPHRFDPPLDSPIRGGCEFAGHWFVFTDSRVYDAGPVKFGGLFRNG
jgi:hypothetical protein